MKNNAILAVIPAYNADRHVSKTIESLLAQKDVNLRIIAIDDCSIDNTYSEITKFSEKIGVFRNEQNSGFAYSLNLALLLAEHEELFFILEHDVELVQDDYLYMAISHFENENVALVSGQAIDFTPRRLSLLKRCFARYLLYDHKDNGVNQISYSYLKADLIRISALKKIGGFGYVGNRKLGLEDQVLAKKLTENGYTLLKDSSLEYRMDFPKMDSISKFIKSEINAGRTLGMAIASRSIQRNPIKSEENRRKQEHRLYQVILVILFVLSLLLAFYSRWALFFSLLIIIIDVIYYLSLSSGFKGVEILYFIFISIINDVVFAVSFYRGILCGLRKGFSKANGIDSKGEI